MKNNIVKGIAIVLFSIYIILIFQTTFLHFALLFYLQELKIII
jgi:hypothetical protein